MYRRQIRRRRAILVLLVVACLVLISTSFSEGDEGPLHSAQNGVGSVLSPLQEGASRVLKPARDLVNWFDETFKARGENDQLRADVQDLRDQVEDLDRELRQGREEAAVVALTQVEPLTAYDRVQARVSARSPSSWDQMLTIDKGRGDGIALDDAVITGDGLVGRVSAAFSGHSRVTLISDQHSSVTVQVLDDGPQGSISAQVGDPNELILELIQGNREIKRGDILVTAGIADPELPSRYPAGIPVGEAQESTPGEQELSQQVHVEPFADLARLEFVTVLTGGPA